MHRLSYSAAVSSNRQHNMTNSTPQTTNQTQTTGLIDVYHPYYLQSSDNPGIALVTQSLTSQNYNQWSRSIKLALSAKNKLGMIDGTLSQPAESSNLFGLWSRCNDMVLSWLLNSISHEILYCIF